MKKLKNGSMEEIMKIAKFNLFSNCLILFVKKNQFIACTRKKNIYVSPVHRLCQDWKKEKSLKPFSYYHFLVYGGRV